MRTIQDVLKYPSAIVTQPFYLDIQYRFNDELSAPLAGLPHIFEIRSDRVARAATTTGSTAPALSAQSEGTRAVLHHSLIKGNEDKDI